MNGWDNNSSRTLKIGKYDVGTRWLAPMAGYTDIAFRTLCRKYGAGLTPTEMVSVRGLVHGNDATERLMRIAECEIPSCIQLFGNDPDDFARVAPNLNCDIIDINMGCPMPKIVKNGDGAALLKDPKLAGRIVAAIVDSTDKPVTVKTRLGYEIGENAVLELVRAVADAGAAAVAVHGRYAEQRYAGNADHSAIETVAEQTDIPIVVNGDIDGDSIGSVFGAPFAAVMIGRAALKNPCVFSDGVARPFEIAHEHVRLLQKYFDERYTINQCRKFFVHYFKGVVGGKAIRDSVNRAETVRDVLCALDMYG